MIKKYLGFHDVRGTYLINLDAEEEGVFITSCAGGVRTDLSLPLAYETKAYEAEVLLTLEGLRGGHSGLDIGFGRANAIASQGSIRLHTSRERRAALLEKLCFLERDVRQVLSEYGIGNGDWVPIVFAGKRRPEFPGCYIEPNHATGISFFEIDSGHVDGTGRIARMMCSTGMKTAEPSIEQFEQGMEDAKAMPVWPLEGSCRYNEELQMIVVKLSDDAE